MTPRRPVHAVGAVGFAVALAVAGCGAEDNSGAGSSPAWTSTTVEQAPIVKHVVAIAAAQAALRTAATAVADGQPFDVELDADGALRFTVTVSSKGAEHKVLVDATGQRVLSQQESGRAGSEAAKLAGISRDAGQALAAAGRQLPGAQFAGLQIDTDDAGAVVWDVELVAADGSEADFHVDAHTGTVTRR